MTEFFLVAMSGAFRVKCRHHPLTNLSDVPSAGNRQEGDAV
jgi:hypothetical protein